MLLEEFLRPLGLKQNEVAQELGISANRLNEIVLGKRGITADTALRLEDRFRMPAQFWMHLQADWDLQTGDWGTPSTQTSTSAEAGAAPCPEAPAPASNDSL